MRLRITVLCTNRAHPVLPWLARWRDEMLARGHDVTLCHDRTELEGGDLLFLVSCTQIVHADQRRRFRQTLVLHASDLPAGRGMSPHVWAILEGATRITVCLLEAQDPVDTGDVLRRASFDLEGHELLPEINDKLFTVELALMTAAVDANGTLPPVRQEAPPSPALRRRTPEDSRIDPHRPLADQFDLLRVVDNARYPAFFDYRGKRYILRIEKEATPS